MDAFARAHDPRPRTLSQCVLPDGGIDMEKYQSCVKYQKENSRQRITALVAATYEEKKKSTKEYNKFFDFDVEETCAKKTSHSLALVSILCLGEYEIGIAFVPKLMRRIIVE